MKKLFAIIIVLGLTISLFAEKLSFQTGDSFSVSNTDYFFPMDITYTACKCTVTSIKKADDGLWCFTLTASKSVNTTATTIFEFYLKKGDVIKMRRVDKPMSECKLKVSSVNWNEISFETE